MTPLTIYKTFAEAESEVFNSHSRQREKDFSFLCEDIRENKGYKKQRTSSTASNSGASQSSYQDDPDDLRHSIRNSNHKRTQFHDRYESMGRDKNCNTVFIKKLKAS